jgi:hypothetical protein
MFMEATGEVLTKVAQQMDRYGVLTVFLFGKYKNILIIFTIHMENIE